MLHAPYVYDLILLDKFKDVAHPVKDKYSIGVIIFEILVGTDLMIGANDENEVALLLEYCFPYLDPATQSLLQFLIFNEHRIDVQMYIDHFALPPSGRVDTDILRFEAGLPLDYMLQQKKVDNTKTMITREQTAYDHYRIKTEEILHNIDKEVLSTLKFNEKNGIRH